ncbi:virion structural protein [Yersinia phage vB_YenS_P400]|nr:virion structural protein [Yersinia phage vB_YenS_P400]
MPLTTDKITQALSARGISIPAFEVDSLLCLVNSITDCLDTNYTDECTKDAILLYSAILIGSSVGGRYITSQSAPSGASQSFGYGSKPWVNLYNQLGKLDPHNCSGAIVESPNGVPGAFFAVVTGSKCR